MKRRSVALFALAIGWLLLGSVAVAAPAAADIGIENTLSESESDDRIDVETRLSIPDSTVELELTLPEGSDVYEREGFEHVEDRTYEWTGDSAEPALRYEYEGTVRGTRGDREGVFFVVAEEWALVRTPGIGVSWRSTDTDSEVIRRNVVEGEGVASSHMAYLGPYTQHTHTEAGQEFRLVVPDAADLREDPDDILATLGAAADRLAIGERGDSVFVVAAPASEHTWASAGLQRGDGGDMWVRDVERLGTARDTWVHEYVHTRQRYATTPETRWTIEGMADYYAALLSYEAGEITYEEFRDRLEDGTDPDYDDVRLADPETWSGTDADYDRGALVFAHLDRRLRAEADTSLDAVVSGVNDPGTELTQRRFLDAIEALGGSELRADIERYTETTEDPPIATRSEHVAAFGGPDVRYSIEGTTVSGPYRNGSLERPTLVAGERLGVTVRAENVGTEPGDFEAELEIDGEAVAVDEGRLEAGESTTREFGYGFDSMGEFDVSVGTDRLSVLVEEPADIEVVEFDAVPPEVTPGEPVTLRATVVAAADRPGSGGVEFAVDGDPVATESARVGEGTVAVETTVTFDSAGEYTVSAGERSRTVTVEHAATEPVTVDDQPGFGPAVAFVALTAGLLARRR